MDAAAQAVPDFVLTICQASRFAEQGFTFTGVDLPYHLPMLLSNLFQCNTTPTSSIFQTFCRLLAPVAEVATHAKCTDPFEFLLLKGSFNSGSDRIKKKSSEIHRASLNCTAKPEFKKMLSEIVIASISYPILGMSRSNPNHRQPNDLFIINLKMKLHLLLFAPTNFPMYVCGTTMDVHAMHAFCFPLVSKMAMHDRIRYYTAPILCKVVQMAGIISTNSLMEI